MEHQEGATEQKGNAGGRKRIIIVAALVVILLVGGVGAYLLAQASPSSGQSQNVNACRTATGSPTQLQSCVSTALNSGPSSGPFKLQSYGLAGHVYLDIINTDEFRNANIFNVTFDGQWLQYDPHLSGKTGTWSSPSPTGGIVPPGVLYDLDIIPPSGSQVTGTHIVVIEAWMIGYNSTSTESGQFTVTLS